MPVRIYQTEVPGVPRSITKRFNPATVAFRLKAGKGVGTVNVINLDNDLQPDARGPARCEALKWSSTDSFV